MTFTGNDAILEDFKTYIAGNSRGGGGLYEVVSLVLTHDLNGKIKKNRYLDTRTELGWTILSRSYTSSPLDRDEQLARRKEGIKWVTQLLGERPALELNGDSAEKLDSGHYDDLLNCLVGPTDLLLLNSNSFEISQAGFGNPVDQEQMAILLFENDNDRMLAKMTI